MNNIRLRFDIDDSFLNLLDIVLKKIKIVDKIDLNPMDINHWGYYYENHKHIIDLFSDPKTYRKISKINSSYEFLVKCIEQVGIENIKFVTSSPKAVQKAKDEAMFREYGSIQNFNKIDIVHVGTTHGEGSHSKNEYYLGNYVLEDGPHNVVDLLKEDPNAFVSLIDFGKFGWNQDVKEDLEKYPNFKRVSNYEEAFDHILEYQKDVQAKEFIDNQNRDLELN